MMRAAPSFRVSAPAAASLLVNGLLIAALLNLGMGHVSRRASAPALTVMSLAQLKGTEQGQDEAVAAQSEPAPVDPPPRATPPASLPQAAPQTPVAILPVPVVAMPSRIALPLPVQAVAQSNGAATPASNPVRQQASASPSPPSSRRGTVDDLDADAPPGLSRSYAARIRSWLYAHKLYPRRARMRRDEGRVQVRFVLDRAGVLLEGAVIKGSGNAVLDGEAEAMMWRASPYPRVPAELPGDRIEFIAPIEFILPV